MMPTILTAEAQEGWDDLTEPAAAASCPYLYSSARWHGWQVGRALRQYGHPRPKVASMSRGYSVRADGRVWYVDSPSPASVRVRCTDPEHLRPKLEG